MYITHSFSLFSSSPATRLPVLHVRLPGFTSVRVPPATAFWTRGVAMAIATARTEVTSRTARGRRQQLYLLCRRRASTAVRTGEAACRSRRCVTACATVATARTKRTAVTSPRPHPEAPRAPRAVASSTAATAGAASRCGTCATATSTATRATMSWTAATHATRATRSGSSSASSLAVSVCCERTCETLGCSVILSSVCVGLGSVCDGQIDCTDGTDEQGCDTSTVAPTGLLLVFVGH